MDNDNISRFLASLGKHVTSLNRILKSIKSDTFIDFIRSDYCGLIVTSNKIASSSDLDIIESYIKNINLVNANNVQLAYFSQSKSYLKVLRISYLIEDTNIPIDSNMIELIIKFTHIFNIYFMSKL